MKPPIVIPADFTTTHETSGLPGYPARDFFGKPDALVLVGFAGRVTKLSGRSPCDGGKPGGAYGRSVYIHSARSGRTWFVTHLASVCVDVGDRVGPGQAIGTVCDSAVSGKPRTSHVHVGRRERTG